MAFLQATTEEMKAMRAKNKPQKQPEGGSDAMYRPSQGRDTNSGSLVQTKVCVCVWTSLTYSIPLRCCRVHPTFVLNINNFTELYRAGFLCICVSMNVI